MFNPIPSDMAARMRTLEEIDQRDRNDGTERLQRLRQIPPETGRFLALLAACAPAGEIVEVGTSAGYSTLWLALACKQQNRMITTYEVLPEKINLAKETFQLAQVEESVHLVEGDAREFLPKLGPIAFCFLDAEKEVYAEIYEMVIPKLVQGGLLVADNAINHRETLQPMIKRALEDNRVDSLIVPIGKGELVCRRT